MSQPTRLVLFSVLLMLSGTILAQRNISGTVFDGDADETLPYATLQVKGTYNGTVTNIDGFFSLTNVPEDTFTLIVKFVGFTTKEIKVEAGTKDLTKFKVVLTTGVRLEEVSVVAGNDKLMKTADGVSVVQLSPEKMSLLPNAGEVDIFRSLQLLPGVSASNESSSGLFVRGGTPDQNLVLLDGMTVYNVDHFFGFFSAFNADAIKDVMLYKGAYPAQYGGRLSSVVNLTSKTGSVNDYSGDFRINLLNASGTVRIPLAGKGSITLSGRRSYTDIIRSGIYENIFGVFNQSEPGNPTLDALGIETQTIQPDFYFYDFNSKISYRPSDKDNIAISLYAGKDDLYEADILDFTFDIGQSSRNIFRDLTEFSDWGNRGASFKWSRQWSPKLYTNALVAYSNYFSFYDRSINAVLSIPELDSVIATFNQISLEENDVRDLNMKLHSELTLSQRVKLNFGGETTQVAVDYSNVRDDTLVIVDVAQQARVSAGYAEFNLQPLQGLKLNAGIRATHFDADGELYYGPRANLEYKVNDALRFKAAYGRHFQFVNRIVNESVAEGSRDFWLLADDALIEVSSADHYVAGATYEWKEFVFDVEGYIKQLYNISEFSLRFQRDISEIQNLFFNGDGYAHGIEFLLQKRSGLYTGWASYTLSQVVSTYEDLNFGKTFYALHDSRHEFKMVHSYDLGAWNFGLTWVYGTGKPYTQPESLYSVNLLDGGTSTFVSIGGKNGERLPDYHRLDLSAHYILRNPAVTYDFGVSIFNAYGRQNVWYREFDFAQQPATITDIRYLGFTPNVSFGLSF